LLDSLLQEKIFGKCHNNNSMKKPIKKY